jgi:hypothetical protein
MQELNIYFVPDPKTAQAGRTRRQQPAIGPPGTWPGCIYETSEVTGLSWLWALWVVWPVWRVRVPVGTFGLE